MVLPPIEIAQGHILLSEYFIEIMAHCHSLNKLWAAMPIYWILSSRKILLENVHFFSVKYDDIDEYLCV